MRSLIESLLRITFAGVLLILPFSTSATVLWADPKLRLIHQKPAGEDVLRGAIKAHDDTSSGTLYLKFTVIPLSSGAEEKGTQYLAGVVFYLRGVPNLGIGNDLPAWGYTAWNVHRGAGLPDDITLNSAFREIETPMGYEPPRRGLARTLICKVDYVPGAHDRVTVWLEPDLGPGKTEASQRADLITEFLADASFDELRLCHHGVGEGWWFKEMAVATSFEDFVAPHIWQRPWVVGMAATFGLLAIGGPVYATDRRRTKRKIELLERERALEKERARIAQDLHDELGGLITRIAWIGQMAELDKAVPERVSTHMGKIATHAQQMVKSMDEIVWALNPVNDTLQSLIQYVAYYANALFEPTAIRCRFAVDPKLPNFSLSSDTRHNLFLAVKEGLNNVLKHARAAQTRIGFEASNDELCITIEDDGCGFDVTAMPAGRMGHGLTNIRKRIEVLGGRFQCESSPGTGTRIFFIVSFARLKKNVR